MPSFQWNTEPMTSSYIMEKQNNKIFRQILVAVIANISSIGFGLGIGWSSPMVPKLQDVTLKDSPLDRILTAGEVGWIGSLVPIGGAISPFVAGTIATKFGRKAVLFLSGFILLSSFIILGVGQNIALFYAARLMHGLCIGLTMTVMPMYIGEIAQDSIRGALGTFMLLFLDVGLLFSYCVGPFVQYANFQFICLAFPIMSLALLPFLPESPTYYLLGEQKDKAIKSLMFLRNATEEDVLTELEIIQRTIKANEEGSWTQLFANRTNVRALTICCGLMAAAQFSGVNAVVYYSQTIFTRAGTNIAPQYAAIILGLVPFSVNWCIPFAIERIGRKINLLISAFGGLIGLSLLSAYFFWNEHHTAQVEYLSFIPICALILYLASFVIGYGPVPWAIAGEIFSPAIKSHATIITAIASSLCAAIVLQFFETLNEAVGPFWVFIIFSVCTVLGIVFVYFYVIETKGLTLLEIQEKLATA